MHKFKMKSKHPINKSTNQIKDPLPTFGEWTPPPATHHPPPVTFPVNKKKKKDRSGQWGHFKKNAQI
jgi:hypothetical protein